MRLLIRVCEIDLKRTTGGDDFAACGLDFGFDGERSEVFLQGLCRAFRQPRYDFETVSKVEASPHDRKG